MTRTQCSKLKDITSHIYSAQLGAGNGTPPFRGSRRVRNGSTKNPSWSSWIIPPPRKSRGADYHRMAEWFVLCLVMADLPSEISPRWGITTSQTSTSRSTFLRVIEKDGNVIRTVLVPDRVGQQWILDHHPSLRVQSGLEGLVGHLMRPHWFPKKWLRNVFKTFSPLAAMADDGFGEVVSGCV